MNVRFLFQFNLTKTCSFSGSARVLTEPLSHRMQYPQLQLTSQDSVQLALKYDELSNENIKLVT